MATIKQIDANRLNALKSTGPNPPEGKATVSMNALRHGMRASTLVLPQEDLGSFQHLCDLLDAEWQPQTPSERFYCEQMAICQWKLIRIEGVEAGAYRSEWGVTKFLLPFSRHHLESAEPHGALLRPRPARTPGPPEIPAQSGEPSRAATAGSGQAGPDPDTSQSAAKSRQPAPCRIPASQNGSPDSNMRGAPTAWLST